MDRAERQRLELQGKSHSLEVRKHEDATHIKKIELELRKEELANQRKLRYTNVSVAVIAAAATTVGGIVGVIIQGNNNSKVEKDRFDRTFNLENFKARESLKLEQQRLQSTLIAKAGESTDVLQVVKRLKFWIQLDLVPKDLLPKLDLAINQDPTLLVSSSTLIGPAQPQQRTSDLGDSVETEAIRRYKSRIAANPKDTDALIYLGYAVLKLGQTNEAIKTLSDAVRINPRSEWGLYNLALAYFTATKISDGENTIKSLLAVNSGFVTIIRKHRQFDQFSTSSKLLQDLLR